MRNLAYVFWICAKFDNCFFFAVLSFYFFIASFFSSFIFILYSINHALARLCVCLWLIQTQTISVLACAMIYFIIAPIQSETILSQMSSFADRSLKCVCFSQIKMSDSRPPGKMWATELLEIDDSELWKKERNICRPISFHLYFSLNVMRALRLLCSCWRMPSELSSEICNYYTWQPLHCTKFTTIRSLLHFIVVTET